MHNSQSSKRRILVAGLLGIGLVAASCSSKKDSATTATTAAASATTAGASSGSTATTTAGSGSTAPTTAGTSAGTTTPATEAPSTTTAAKVTTGGSLIVAGEAEVTNPWDPAAMQCDSFCYERAFTFFDPLTVIGNDRKAHPFLAETITPNSDYTQWTIKVRPGIKFTDGTDLNADAVIFNLQRTGNSLLVGASVLDLAKVPDPADATKKIFQIDKVDDMTLTIHTGLDGDPTKPTPWPGFPVYLSGQLGLIGSPTWEQGIDAKTADPSKPIGTGPFTVESFAPRDNLVVKRNPNYWMKDAAGRQLPYLDQITFRVIADATITEQALQAGNIDIFSTSDANVVKDMRDQKAKFPMTEQDKYTETNFYLMDLTKAPFDDQDVRCAMSMAIDRTEIIAAVGGGITKEANGVFGPGKEGYLDDNGFDPAQNIDAAKALIEKYKAAHGGQAPTIDYGTTTTSDNAARADLLKGYWTAIGMNVKTHQVPQDSFITNALFGVPDFQIYGWRQYGGTNVDPLNFWWNSRGAHPDGQLSLNFMRMNDPQVDADLAKIRSTADDNERIAASEDINRIFASKCYVIPQDYTLWGTPHKPAIQGLNSLVGPDGAGILDGAGFPGQFWVTGVWVQA